MSSSRHEEILGLFRQACELQGEERAALLADLDPATREEVESLLRFDVPDERVPLTASDSALSRNIMKLADVEPRIPVPESIGNYKILEVIGRGGMGVVYRAKQDNPQRLVALKVVRPEVLGERTLRRFQYEVEVLGRLQHPGIAQVYEAGTAETPAGWQPYFAMELIEGESLLSYADSHKLGTRQRLALFEKICDAVHHAHQKGVIHRDLKPGNILVDADGQPKILDFGIARATGSDLQMTSFETDIGHILGTVAYMSPEQASGDPQLLDVRSDVYSLGVVLYELLAGRLPYSVGNCMIHEAVRVIREDNPTPLSNSNKVFRGDVETIVQKAIEKEKARRYVSASAFSDDIHRYLTSQPIEARPAGALYQLWKFACRNQVLVGGIVATFVALVIGLVSTLSWARVAEQAARDAEAEGQAARTAEQMAVQEEAKAQAQLEEKRRFSDRILVTDLLEEASQLWPRRAEKIDEYEDWIVRAESLYARYPKHVESLEIVREETLAKQRLQGVLGPEDTEPLWRQTGLDERFRFETFSFLVEHLRDFPDIIAEVKERRAFAGTIEQRSISDHEAEWAEAIDEIFLSETYDLLELQPQVGLVPLGPDPVSGLWEFWHVESGERPQHKPGTARLTPTASTGLILVLIPGAVTTIGSQMNDPEAPYYDPGKQPPHFHKELSLDPFFLSKYEMTLGQWKRLMHRLPQGFGPTTVVGRFDDQDYHPLRSVTFLDCEEVLHRGGLRFPTEAQWECAARAGTHTRWWCGDTKDSIRFAGNIADRGAKVTFESSSEEFELWDDGAVMVAPVGSYDANPFGLHDVIGNVNEWCADLFWDADAFGHRAGDGLHMVPEDRAEMRALRGGCFSSTAAQARHSARQARMPANRGGINGLRPARGIDRD